MQHQLHLYTPKLSELWYRRQILSDASTMSYNKGYNLNFEGYHNDTGCIDFPEEHWKMWYDWFVGGSPERFYAYIVRDSDHAFIGEVNIHKSNNDWYDIGILIESKYRGNGYSAQALRLLLTEAFEKRSVLEIHNDFEKKRISAIKAHLSAGFVILGEDNGMVHLCITKDQYFVK